MFTGIVEELGTIEKITTKGNTLVLIIQGEIIMSDLNLGDSIAVNGVCLTVTDFGNRSFMADVMPETYKDTSLSRLKPGSQVNLERAMGAGGRFGGHFVSGHIDTVGKIVRKKSSENAIYIDISFPPEYSHYILPKGSIALDGTSLTVFGIQKDIVTVSIIPHTAKETVLGLKDTGDIVNIEFDMIGKYLYSFLRKSEQAATPKEDISTEFLRKNGFM